MSRILVTGAGGVITHGVATRLLRAGHEVVATDTRGDSMGALRSLGARVVEADLRSAEVCNLVRDGRPDVVVHAGAMVSNVATQQHPKDAFDVNVAAAVALLDSARRAATTRFVYLSSRAVYGLSPDGRAADPPVSEDSPLDPAGVYDVCKVAVEGMGRNFAQEFGLEFTALRFATIFGPGKSERHSNASLFSRIIEGAFAGEPVRVAAPADEAYDLVYADDVRSAVFAAAVSTRTLRAAYNVGSGRTTTLGELVSALEKAVPGCTVELTGEGQGLPLRYRYPLDITLARNDLDYLPAPSVADGVRAYVEALRAERSSAM